MTDAEMIAKFLAENEVTVSEVDGDRQTNHQTRVSNIYGESLVPSKQFTPNENKMFTCELCGRRDKIVYINHNYSNRLNRGMVNFVYKGDVWCDLCRRKERNKHRKEASKKAYYAKLGLFSKEDITKYTSISNFLNPELRNWPGSEATLIEAIQTLEYLRDLEYTDTTKFDNAVTVLKRALEKGRYKEEVDDNDWDELPLWAQMED